MLLILLFLFFKFFFVDITNFTNIFPCVIFCRKTDDVDIPLKYLYITYTPQYIKYVFTLNADNIFCFPSYSRNCSKNHTNFKYNKYWICIFILKKSFPWRKRLKNLAERKIKLNLCLSNSLVGMGNVMQLRYAI